MSRRPQCFSTAAPEREASYLAVQVLSVDTETRQVTGLAVPYDEPTVRTHFATGARWQRFAQGSAKVRDNAVLFYGHDHLTQGLPVGRIASSKDTKAGLTITAKISATAKGDEVYTLLKDGVLDSFSIGFYEVAGAYLEDEDTYEHTEVDVFETSTVPDPQYKTAKVAGVLSRSTHESHLQEGTTMTEEQRRRLAALRAQTNLSEADAAELSTLAALEPGAQAYASAEDVQALTAGLSTLERQIATLGDHQGSNVPAVPFDSYGEFIQALAAGDNSAVEFLAYVGGTTADLGDVLKDSWVGERFRLVTEQRTVLNFFASSPLPASGMGVEYAKLKADTTKVEKQAAEGDTLAYGKVEWETARAALETFGGWGDMSRQEIERSPINVVERFFEFLLNRYAQTTEAKVNAAATAGGVALTGGVLDLATADGWTRFVIRAAKVLKDQGYPLEGLLVGWDVFEDLAVLRDGAANDAPRLLDRNSGTINLTGLKGEMFTLPVIPISTGATTDVVRAANAQAIRTYEAGGAPFRLQDDDITNLTKAFSIYGYMATATEVPAALVKPQTV